MAGIVNRRLKRRVDLCRNFLLPALLLTLAFSAASAASASGTANSINGWYSANNRVCFLGGSIGQRVLCLFRGTHRGVVELSSEAAL